MPSVLVVGYDPRALPGVDAEALQAALDKEMTRFHEHGIEAGAALIVSGETAEPTLAEALARRPWDVVVIGGGIRKTEELLPLFEETVNLIRHHAPQAAIAFNSGVGDSVEAARRRL